MTLREGIPSEDAAFVNPADVVEIVSPLADAMRVLAHLIQLVPGSLAGASIATGEKGTLLLNGCAWTLFGEALQREIPTLKVSVVSRGSTKPLRFLLYGDGMGIDRD